MSERQTQEVDITKADMDDARRWYAERRYDIGRDEMVADRPPPAWIADDVAKAAEVSRRHREGMREVYAAWSRGEEAVWPKLMSIMSDVYGWKRS